MTVTGSCPSTCSTVTGICLTSCVACGLRPLDQGQFVAPPVRALVPYLVGQLARQVDTHPSRRPPLEREVQVRARDRCGVEPRRVVPEAYDQRTGRSLHLHLDDAARTAVHVLDDVGDRFVHGLHQVGYRRRVGAHDGRLVGHEAPDGREVDGLRGDPEQARRTRLACRHRLGHAGCLRSAGGESAAASASPVAPSPASPWPETGTGSVNEKVLPSPSRLSTQMRPPCRSTICLQIGSPSPVPYGFWVSVSPTCANCSKTLG